MNILQIHATSWVKEAFGPEAMSTNERRFRFAEEAIELMQSVGLTREDIGRFADHVYSRPPGDTSQEIGGVMLTLVTLAESLGCDAYTEGERELNRVNTSEVMAKCRAKNRVALRGESE
jgi:hypothetical protein